MTNAITFFEISGPDRESLRGFYREGLGLDVAPFDNDYAGIAPREGAIAGGLWDGTATFGQYAIPYVEVADVKAAVEQATAAGATVVVPPTTHGPTLTAHVTDPAGNRIGLFHMLETPGGTAG
jgi:hypothetical protein